ncbi:hypothetical protein EXT60_18510 [Pectobacterium carotovorum subsp. carotovorum]|nr:hypothetical protein [Pectobacterium carotovorum]MCL6366225.1 hypothetical protein [Pectobacterium carotovorum subsp. carotovorum]
MTDSLSKERLIEIVERRSPSLRWEEAPAMAQELLRLREVADVSFHPKNLDQALTIMGCALPVSKEEFNFQTERWIQRLIDRVIRFESDIPPLALDVEERERLLAYDRAAKEPVFFIEIEGDDWIQSGRIPGSTFDFNNLPVGINNLYAAPPLPLVPDEMSFDDASMFVLNNGMANENRATLAMHAYNHCRASMLQPDQFRDATKMVDHIPDVGNMVQLSGNTEQLIDYKAIVERISEVAHGGVTDINLLTITVKSMIDRLKGNYPVIPEGWALVPIEPTERMVIEGFESEPDESFSEPDDWEAYQAMSGCEQAGHRARLCWAAMVAAAPQLELFSK